jgi:flagellar hook protein FlgE
MGIYGALSTAVTGLRAQSFALENISGNIANSQTTGFKRVDTDFLDLIPDAALKRQTAGSVLAQSRATNTSAGDIKSVSNTTYMAVNGSGFFVVEPAIGQSDGTSVFGGANYYTRRGDFDVNKNGYLVNGAGYYLKGLPIDPATGNISSSMPEVIRISNAFLPAQPTTRVNYQLNLPDLPKNGAYKASQTVGSELFRPQDFKNVPNNVSARIEGATGAAGDASSDYVTAGNTLHIKVGSTTLDITFTDTGATGPGVINIADAANDTLGELLGVIEGQLVAAGASGATVGLEGNKITIDTQNTADTLTVTDTTSGLGLSGGPVPPSVGLATQLNERVSVIKAADEADFIDQSISGGAITVYSQNGAPANLQLRWAKIASAEVGGVDRWNLFYLKDGAATGSATKWVNIGTDYTFGPDGGLNPPITETAMGNVLIDGVAINGLKLSFGQGGITQFADPNGTAGVTERSQNGYGAGEFVSVAIGDNGRVVVSYDNGQQVEVAQVVTANFNAANQLKRMDGGTFAATADSGEPILDVSGGIVGASLESSNTDISEEFTKLIVTQQAYAAGTRIVSTADQMLQEALNMIR